MPFGNDFSTIDPTVEKVTLTFNFASWFGPGVTITSVASITVSVSDDSSTQDPNPQNIIFGSPQISNLPGLPANTAVMQQVANTQTNVIYLIQCLVNTSDNQIENLAAHLPCVPLN